MKADGDSMVTGVEEQQKPTTGRRWTKASMIHKVFISRIDGLVNQEVAKQQLGLKSQSALYELAERGMIEVVWWDNRTPMYVEASINTYIETKRDGRGPRRKSEKTPDTQEERNESAPGADVSQ